MKYVIFHKAGHRVMAAVLPSAIKAYLRSYTAHHADLIIYNANDEDHAEGMSVEEWLLDNESRCETCGGKPDSFLGLCDCPVSLCGSDPKNP